MADGEAAAPRTLEDWALALERYFFAPRQRGRRVYFSVSDEALDEIAQTTSGQGAETLVRAVRPQLRLTSQRNLFEDVYTSGTRWSANREPGPPPFLPCLALCVLAASRMESSQGLSAGNYYERLRIVLDLPHSPQPAYAETIPATFRLFHEWIQRGRGVRGASTIPDVAVPAHIGYALSQALIRESDRRKLTAFFIRLDLQPQDWGVSGQLLPALRYWAARSTLSWGAKRLISDPQYERDALSFFEDELKNWDLNERDDDGRVVGRIAISLRVTGGTDWALIASRPRGFPETAAWTSGAPGSGLRTLTLQSSIPEIYDPVSLGPSLPDWILEAHNHPLVFKCGQQALHLALPSVVPLGPDPNTGRLTSTRRVQPSVRHWLLVHGEVAQAAEDLLGRIAREGWARVANSPVGWRLYRDVFVDLPPTFEVPPGLAPLVPGVEAKPELCGGLPLGLLGGEPLYLQGGPPDVWLPHWLSQTIDTPPSVDGQPVPAGDRTGGRLRVNRDLAVGIHVVRLGTFSLRFRIVNGMPPELQWQSAPGSLVLRAPFLAATSSTGTGPAGTVVCGGVVDDGSVGSTNSRLTSIRLPHGALRYTLIGSDFGCVAACAAPPRPRWLEEVGLLTQDFEVIADFRVAWARIDWQRSGSEILRVADVSPSLDAPGPAPQEWIEAVLRAGSLRDPGTAPSWEEYRNLAEASQGSSAA